MNAASLCPPDGSDGPGGGGGLLPLLAASPPGPPVGRVRDLPHQPGLLRAAGRRPLLGVQQLVRQPRHLRFPVGELPQGVQAGVPLSDQRQRLAPQRHQGDTQQGGHAALHQLHQRLRRCGGVDEVVLVAVLQSCDRESGVFFFNPNMEENLFFCFIMEMKAQELPLK